MSGNEHKIAEVVRILGPIEVEVVPVSKKIEELQTEDVQKLVRDKVTKAFEIIGRPLFVEHTGLHLAGLNGLPGGLTQIFWDRLQADDFTRLVSGLVSNVVLAKTVLGYCDGKAIHLFEGETHGTVPSAPAGPREFQWDCAFVPEGSTQTFAQMGLWKDTFSMRRKALELFAAHLNAGSGPK
jgi:XTP/dITP diphosphohydrolase